MLVGSSPSKLISSWSFGWSSAISAVHPEVLGLGSAEHAPVPEASDGATEVTSTGLHSTAMETSLSGVFLVLCSEGPDFLGAPRGVLTWGARGGALTFDPGLLEGPGVGLSERKERKPLGFLPGLFRVDVSGGRVTSSEDWVSIGWLDAVASAFSWVCVPCSASTRSVDKCCCWESVEPFFWASAVNSFTAEVLLVCLFPIHLGCTSNLAFGPGAGPLLFLLGGSSFSAVSARTSGSSAAGGLGTWSAWEGKHANVHFF